MANENTPNEATGDVTPNGEKQKRVRVPMETFIRVWEDSDSVGEVSNRTGLKPTSVTQRATKYRNKYGVPLKKMTGGGAKFDPQAARDYLAQLRNESEESEESEDETVDA